MSHQPERKEKNCLNCGTTVAGRYCQKCGQENIVPKQSFGALIRHFIYDIFHFDGKFFDTLKFLLFRPGSIPKEYVAGKRHSWLDPIRMYLFTSAIFFLVFFALNKPGSTVKMDGNNLMTRQERFEYASGVNSKIQSDSIDIRLKKQLNYLLDPVYMIILSDTVITDTAIKRKVDWFSVKYKDYNFMNIIMKDNEKTDMDFGGGWIVKQVNQWWRNYKEKYGDDIKLLLTDLSRTFLNKLPYILFVSLPIFALFLKLLYSRRKNFYYSDHAVFTLYHYIFCFILLAIFFLLSSLFDLTGWGIFHFVRILLILYGGVYLYIAMKRFYGLGKTKTFFKFLLLSILALVTMLLLFILFFILSIFQL